MGVLLGDGHLDDALEFTNLDPEIVQKTRQLLEQYNLQLKKYDYHVDGHYNIVANENAVKTQRLEMRINLEIN